MKILLAIALLLLTTSLFAQSEDKKEQAIRKKNQIKKVLAYQYNLETGDSLLLYINEYDEEGKFLNYSSYNEAGIVVHQYIASYNSKGLMTQQVEYQENEALGNTFFYQYNELGQLTHFRQVDAAGKIWIDQKKTYDKKGNNTLSYDKSMGSADYTLSRKILYQKNGRSKKVESYLPNNKLLGTSFYQYDKHGNLLAYYTLEEGQKKLNYRQIYNRSHQKIEVISTPQETTKAPAHRTTYGYDQAGNLVEERTWLGAVLEEQVQYSFEYFK